MLPGISGALIAGAFLEDVLLPELDAAAAVDVRRPSRRCGAGGVVSSGQLGPASSARAVLDVAVLPLVDLLQYRLLHLEPHHEGFVGTIGVGGTPVAVLRTTVWGADPDLAWRDAVRAGRTAHVSWGLVCTGPTLRIVDASRAWSRRALDFDLATSLADRRSATAFRALTSSAALSSTDSQSLARVVDRADAHGVRVCETLGGLWSGSSVTVSVHAASFGVGLAMRTLRIPSRATSASQVSDAPGANAARDQPYGVSGLADGSSKPPLGSWLGPDARAGVAASQNDKHTNTKPSRWLLIMILLLWSN